jgi:hypothetical protein
MEELQWIGCEFICIPEVAEDLRRDLRDAVGEILEAYTAEEIIDYGVD